MKYIFINDHRCEFRVKKMCQVLKVSRSGYYAFRNRGRSYRELQNQSLLKEIVQVHESMRKVYGSPRITKELHSRGIRCSKNRVARIMRASGISAKCKRRFKATTNSSHNLPVAENLLNREFKVDEPNKVWVSDITYIWTAQGWLYLAVVLDLFSRQIVGWSMGDMLTKEVVIKAFLSALQRRKPKAGLLFHSDRGSQYAAEAFRNILNEYSFIQSMSRKGDCWDNAVAESFFHTLKMEEVYHEKYLTRSQARQSIFQYIEAFYNRVRKHSTLGYLSPWEFEEKANVA